MSRISSWFLSGVLDRLDAFEHMLGAIQRTLQQVVQGQTQIMLTTQDLQAKADAAAAANNQLIALTKEQAQLLRNALANGDPAAQEAAMQKVADTLDGIGAADAAEVAADTVGQASGDGTTAQPGA